MFNLIQKWNFPSNNYGQIFGIADSGVETFKGTPIKSLAREICQNSLDAALENGEPTRIEFKTFEIDPHKIPDYSNLEDALKRALDFWSQQQSTKAKTFFKQALDVIHKSTITCLRISDFNTSGLVGSREEYNSPWCNLTKSSGASDKSGSHGGSFGIGKFAPYACSSLRTVFYSTSDKDGLCASQGVSRLTSFKSKKNEITQGTGFYGNDKNSPMYKQFSLDSAYSRSAENSGTDIFIAAFNGDKGWQHQMVASVLDGFLYAIYNGTLVVDVDGTIISKDSLADLMISHKEYFNEHADEYYQALTDEKLARTFTKELTDDPETIGKLTLKLMIMPSFSRRVAMIRQTGMKIKDKGNINGLIPFAGTLFIEGDAINSYLRSLENPQHLEWEVERAECLYMDSLCSHHAEIQYLYLIYTVYNVIILPFHSCKKKRAPFTALFHIDFLIHLSYSTVLQPMSLNFFPKMGQNLVLHQMPSQLLSFDHILLQIPMQIHNSKHLSE